MLAKLTSIGIISQSCPKCEQLKNNLRRDFDRAGFPLIFIEIVYEEDPEEAMKVASRFDLKSIPSFYIDGFVFEEYYGESQISAAVKAIREGKEIKDEEYHV